MIELVVTDLDGTLWDVADQLHPRTAAAIEELGRRGVDLLVATGRRVTSTRDPLARAGLAPSAVVLNGALGLDLATAQRFHRQPFPAEEAVIVFDAFVTHGLEPCVYVDHVGVDAFLGPSPSTHPEHVRALGTTAQRGDLAVVVREMPVLGFGVIGRPIEELRAAQELIALHAEAHLGRAFNYPDSALTVAPRGLSKWAGVMAYCKLRGLDHEAVLAIGDGPNDLELLQHAAIAVVPEDGDPAALARAKHVVAPPDRGGWAEILDFIG